MEFRYLNDEAGAVATWLKVRPGRYVRIDAIDVCGAHFTLNPNAPHGEACVFVKLASEQVIECEPCSSMEAAEQALDQLVLLLEENAGRKMAWYGGTAS